MPPCLTAACVVGVALAPVLGLPTAFWQVAPLTTEPGTLPVKIRERAVLLIHGLQPHPLRPDLVGKPAAQPWQLSKSELVKALAVDSDVYAFSYAQTVPVDAVAGCRGLRDAVASLKAVGYREVVLVGHSAGGLVARHFAERFPDAGATKVVMVATPHAGTGLANLRIGVPSVQAPFVRSLSPKTRAVGKAPAVADEIGLCCVVCKLPRLAGDTVVPAASQWPEELQKLGVPVELVGVSHFDAVRDPKAVAVIVRLANDKLTRWDETRVAEGRRTLFGEERKKTAEKK